MASELYLDITHFKTNHANQKPIFKMISYMQIAGYNYQKTK